MPDQQQQAAAPRVPNAPLGRVLMVQGTSSYAGKSTLVAALCRIFVQAGYRVAPFKAQNMSNNAAVTDSGGEIGRAQAVQAMAARVTPTVDMNPILLKPQGDQTSQVVVLGRAWRTMQAREYYARTSELWPFVTAALDRLRAAHDIVVVEGAGSPAEINLADHDIVNMRVALYADAPVLIVGDIDRGGVFAALYGTVDLLEPEERKHVRGFVINKFRGDPSLLTPGFAMLEERTGVPTLGVLPYLDLSHLPAEDGLELDAQGRFVRGHPDNDPADLASEPVLDIAVLRFPRIANLDEFQPLANEPGVEVRFVRDPAKLGSPDLIILPGTKATMADLAWMRDRGLDAAVRSRCAAARTPVLGLCGGYQMLGTRIVDPTGVEAKAGAAVDGLGLLPAITTFAEEKVTERVQARTVSATALWSADPQARGQTSEQLPHPALNAYEIHMGRTEPIAGADIGAAPFEVTAPGGRTVADGLASTDGLVVGTYLHGLFENVAFRRHVLEALAARHGRTLPPAGDGSAPGTARDDPEAAFDELANAVRRHLDLAAIARLVDLPALDALSAVERVRPTGRPIP
jgi:adenosylcobyric acid synthase